MRLIAGILLTTAYRLALIYWRLVRPDCLGVFVALWHDDRILVIKNSYKSQLTFPGGGVKSSESAIQAAARELREEVGIEIDSTSLSFVQQFLCRSEFKKDHATAFEVVLEKEPDVRIDGFEVIESSFISFNELCQRRNEFTETVNCYIDWKLAQRSD